MKISIAQKDLLSCLKTVSRAVASQNALPVLSNILLRAEDGKLYFSATNLEISIFTYCDAEIEEEGAITIPAKILTSYTSLLSKSESIELCADELTLKLNSPSSKTSIKGISADEFPSIKPVESGIESVIPASDFRKGVQEVAFAALENAARPIFGGVLVYSEEAELYFVGTDSFRLSEKKIENTQTKGDMKCLVPVRALYEADRLVGECENVKMVVSENEAMFEFDNAMLVTRLIEGNYPDYKRIIPSEHTTFVEVEREPLALAVRRGSIFARENNQFMRLHFSSEGVLNVLTDQTQVGEEQATVPIKIEGDDCTISVSADYVLDILTALSSQKIISMKMKGGNMPALIEKSPESEGFRHIIMPLKG